MSIYFFYMGFIFMLCFLSFAKRISHDVVLFLSMLLFILSAIRFDVGRDYSGYLTIFYEPNKMSSNEQGFMFLNRLFKSLGFSYQGIAITYAFFTILFAEKYISKTSENPILSLFIFFAYTPFYLQTFNTMRQGLAIYAFLYSLKYVSRKKFIIFFIFILFFAFFAHQSVLVCIPLYFLCKIKFKVLQRFFLILLALSICLVIDKIIEHSPYAIYLNFNIPKNILSPVFLFDILICLSITFFLPCDENNILEWNLCYFSLCLLFMSAILIKSPLYIITTRFNEYFLPSVIILIPQLINNKKYKSFLFTLVVLSMGTIFFLSIIVNGKANELVPYKTFFGKFPENIVLDICLGLIFILIYATRLLSKFNKTIEVSK